MIFNKNHVGGSDFWLNSSSLDFHEIQKQSGVTERWRYPDHNYDFKIIKPVNQYASNFTTRPEIIIHKNKTIIRQKTHAEIWVQPMKNFLYALDKTMQRQFYPSEIKFNNNFDCFLSSYKFYVPWIIDENVVCEIASIEKSPFIINTKSINFMKNDLKLIKSQWIHFFIKKEGPHMITKKYGIIETNTPMFDIIVDNKSIEEKIIEQFR